MALLFQLHVALTDLHPTPWRRLLASPEMPLTQLHELLQEAMGWGHYRSYRFFQGEKAWGPPDLHQAEVLRADQATLGDLLSESGQVATYRYHIKHHWDHHLRLEKAVHKRRGLPRLTAGEGRTPPEEVPGAAAYTQVLAARQGQGGLPEDAYLAWLVQHHEPRAFSLKTRRRAVQAWFGNPNELVSLTAGVPLREVAGLLRFMRDHLRGPEQGPTEIFQFGPEGEETMDIGAPPPELIAARGGLDQRQMETLITAPFGDYSPLRLQPPAKEQASPFLPLLRQVMEKVADQAVPPEGTPLTQPEAWLPLVPADYPLLPGQPRILPVQVAWELIEHQGWFRPKRKPSYHLTRKARALLKTEDLWCAAFEAFCLRYPWSHWDQTEDESLGQWAVGFTLLMLKQHGQESHQARDYAQAYLRALPIFTDYAATNDAQKVENQRIERWIRRTFDFLGLWWGLTESQALPTQPDTEVQASPLLREVISGQLEPTVGAGG